MAYTVKTLVVPDDTSNVQKGNEAFKPLVDAVKNCGFLDFQQQVLVEEYHYYLNYFKFKLHPNKGLRIVSGYQTYERASQYYIDLFDWTDGLDVQTGDPPLPNKRSILYMPPQYFKNITFLYQENVVLQVYGLNIFYIKSPDDPTKQELVAMYQSWGDDRSKWSTSAYSEFLSDLRFSYAIDFNNQSGGPMMICGTPISFQNNMYNDKIYTGTRNGGHRLKNGYKYRMYNVADGSSEVMYFMYPIFYLEV